MWWLDLLIPLGFASLACAGVVSTRHLVPWDRVRKIVRAHLPDGRRMRNLSIDMAMHTLADVDAEWWQDRFDKLVKATAPRAVPTGLLQPPTEARPSDANRTMEHAEWELTEKCLRPSYTIHNGNVIVEHAGGLVGIERVREAERLVRDIKRWEPSVHEWQATRAARHIVSATTREKVDESWGALRAMMEGAIRAEKLGRDARLLRELSEKVVDDPCPDCEYEDVSTYADSGVRRIRTWDCPTHRAQPIRVEESDSWS